MEFTETDFEELKELGRKLREISNRTGLLINITAKDYANEFDITAWSRQRISAPALSYTEVPSPGARYGRVNRKIFRDDECDGMVEYFNARDQESGGEK